MQVEILDPYKVQKIQETKTSPVGDEKRFGKVVGSSWGKGDPTSGEKLKHPQLLRCPTDISIILQDFLLVCTRCPKGSNEPSSMWTELWYKPFNANYRQD